MVVTKCFSIGQLDCILSTYKLSLCNAPYQYLYKIKSSCVISFYLCFNMIGLNSAFLIHVKVIPGDFHLIIVLISNN